MKENKDNCHKTPENDVMLSEAHGIETEISEKPLG